jgi:hypothetical protein
LPTDVTNGLKLDELHYSTNTLSDYADEMQYRMKRAHDNVLSKHKALQDEREQENALIKRPKQFKVGELVMVHFPNDKKNKLSLPWRGPYVVTKRTSNVNYEVDFPAEDGRKPYSVVHVDRLKAFKPDPNQQ